MATKNSTEAIAVAEVLGALRTLFVELFPTIGSGDWVNLSAEEQEPFIRLVHKMDNCVNVKLLPAFNKSVWDGQDEGKVVETITVDGKPVDVSTRKRRNPDAAKPGRKATPKTLDEVFDSL